VFVPRDAAALFVGADAVAEAIAEAAFAAGTPVQIVRNGSRGCLRCLFEDLPELRNTADFVAPGQRFERRELGCHGVFTPYGDTDARETALCAVRLVERALRAPASPAWMRSWRGDAAALRVAGYRTSARYDLVTHGVDEALTAKEDCLTCASS
jgi:hypothetical protein